MKRCVPFGDADPGATPWLLVDPVVARTRRPVTANSRLGPLFSYVEELERPLILIGPWLDAEAEAALRVQHLKQFQPLFFIEEGAAGKFTAPVRQRVTHIGLRDLFADGLPQLDAERVKASVVKVPGAIVDDRDLYILHGLPFSHNWPISEKEREALDIFLDSDNGISLTVAAKKLSERFERDYVGGSKSGKISVRSMYEAIHNPAEVEPTFDPAWSIQDVLGGIALRQSQLRDVKEELDELAQAARGMGATWARIGEAAGISGQSAYQRWSEQGKQAHREKQRRRVRGQGQPKREGESGDG